MKKVASYFTHTHTHARTHTHAHTHTHTRTHARTHARTRTHTHTHTTLVTNKKLLMHVFNMHQVTCKVVNIMLITEGNAIRTRGGGT